MNVEIEKLIISYTPKHITILNKSDNEVFNYDFKWFYPIFSITKSKDNQDSYTLNFYYDESAHKFKLKFSIGVLTEKQITDINSLILKALNQEKGFDIK